MRCRTEGCDRLATHGCWCWHCRDDALRKLAPRKRIDRAIGKTGDYISKPSTPGTWLGAADAARLKPGKPGRPPEKA